MLLLRPKYLIIKNKFKRAKQSGYRRELMLGLISGIIVVCIYLAFYLLFRGIRGNPSFAMIIPRKIIDLMYSYFFVLLTLSSVVAAMSNIYSSETIQLALQAPISSFRLYLGKYVETAIEVGFMFFILSTPAALAYVIALGVPWTFIPVAGAISVVFILIPVGFGIALATIFAQLIALLWKRGGILLFGIMCAFIGAAARLAGELERVREKKEGAQAFAGMVGLSANDQPLWLPSRWASDLVGSYLTGFVEGASAKVSLLLTSALASFCLGFFLFDLFSMRVRSSAHIHVSEEGRVQKDGDIFRRIFEWIVGVLPFGSKTRAIMLKDLSSTVRDRAQALQLLLYLGLGALYVTIYSFLSNAMNLSAVAQQLWIAFLATSNVLLVGFMTTTILTRLVYPSVSLEGRSFWILQVTPIQVQEMVRAKLLCWLPLTIFLSSTLMMVGALAVGLTVSHAALVLLIGVAISLGTTALAIGLGARYASFDWDSPSQISVGFGTLTLLLLSVSIVMLFTLPSGVLLFFTIVPRLRELIGVLPSFCIMVGALFLILFGAASLVNGSIRSGSRALESRLREI